MISRKCIVITIYILIVLLIFTLKPSMMFDMNGNIKQFGYESSSNSPISLLSAEIVLPILALMSYISYLIIELIII